MGVDPLIARVTAEHDQFKALLSECLSRIDTAKIIGQLEQDFNEANDMGDKLLYHAALVGIVGTMLDEIETGATR
jgi:hypothetical protein